MKLLLKRSQATNLFKSPIFKLGVKIEFDEQEQALIKRYEFAKYRMTIAFEPTLLRNAGIVALVTLLVAWVLLSWLGGFGNFLALCAGGGAGWYYFDRTRETMYVRDFINGRYFDCPSVVALAKQEAFLSVTSSYLRQLMETAKNWGNTDTYDIEPLPPDEAKRLVIKRL